MAIPIPTPEEKKRKSAFIERVIAAYLSVGYVTFAELVAAAIPDVCMHDMVSAKNTMPRVVPVVIANFDDETLVAAIEDLTARMALAKGVWSSTFDQKHAEYTPPPRKVLLGQFLYITWLHRDGSFGDLLREAMIAPLDIMADNDLIERLDEMLVQEADEPKAEA